MISFSLLIVAILSFNEKR
ncbi:hypothetical protein [Evansella clarkii]